MIEIFPNSLISFFIALITKIYLLSKRKYRDIKISLYYHPYKSHIPTTYFIIKSMFLSANQLNLYLQDIRAHSELANIIIIGSHINYEELFRNHYRVFGVIDTTENKSLKFIRNQIHFYLDSLYGSKNV
ncbi:hypothetical protein [Streptococcus himalayensis]|uniref:Uncharacterized protein n=1 Tax=Streptococcus himalayensis TaxID=1888195 RepID=A0A917EE86_9STRE|nr:hypothetical protein [Streptococcus himalayensis]GGE28942.1 hypothetical protein GCM10011510_07760 [Streptococcus himalayensis]